MGVLGGGDCILVCWSCDKVQRGTMDRVSFVQISSMHLPVQLYSTVVDLSSSTIRIFDILHAAEERVSSVARVMVFACDRQLTLVDVDSLQGKWAVGDMRGALHEKLHVVVHRVLNCYTVTPLLLVHVHPSPTIQCRTTIGPPSL
jgi:hypothetical protein